MRAPTTCAKCGGSLSAGFIVDQGHGLAEASKWQDGEPKRVWYGGVRMSKDDQFGITTFRCDRCGYLESYALG
jgi:predicted nucleic-acid-binding Zn-ribbon protein